MRVAAMNWMQMDAQVKRDDRCVLPLGSVEQHAYLSLATDVILAEKIAVEAAEPLNIPVFPVLAYGMTPGFMAYPGTVSLRMSTYLALIEDVIESLYMSGFRRIILINGHGGNSPILTVLTEWMGRRPDCAVRLHDWWSAPKVMAKVHEFDVAASHASWMENFPWTRLDGVALPQELKPPFDRARYQAANLETKRALLGDGNFHGRYARPDAEMLAIWQVGVAEARAAMAENWP